MNNILLYFNYLSIGRMQSKMTLQRTFEMLCYFFIPSLGKYIGRPMFGNNTGYFRDVFWNSMNTRELTKVERGDVIDSLLKLKNGKQITDFSENKFYTIIFYNK